MIKKGFVLIGLLIGASFRVIAGEGLESKAFIADSLELREVVVTGARDAADVRHLPMTVTVIGQSTLEESHLVNVLPTVMRYVPGVIVTSRSMMGYGVSTGAAGGINSRGLSSSSGQLMVLVDGHPQYNGIYGHPISDSYQTSIIERVEVLRGPASVLYGGNAMGGVVNLVTKSMSEDGVSSGFDLSGGSYGTFQAKAHSKFRGGKFNGIVSSEYGRTDNHRPRMGFEQYGGYTKLGYDLTSHWRSYADLQMTRFNASYPGATDKPMYGADQWITRGMAEIAIKNHYSRTSGALSVYSSFGRHKIDDGTTSPTTSTERYFRSKDALTGVSWYQSVSFFQGNLVTMGADYQHIYGRAYYTSKTTGKTLVTPGKQSGHSHRDEVAVYVDARHDIFKWLTAAAGVRVDHHSVTGTEWIPQAGFVIRPIKSGDVKAMVSKGFRNPTMREMYLYPSSNEDLRPERIWNYEISWHQRSHGVSYGVNLFYVKGDNLIQNVQNKNVNTGKLENYGLEAEASCRIDGHWQVVTNHSVLRMEHPVVASPEYQGFLGVDFRYGKWLLNVGAQYVNDLYTSVGKVEQTENFCLVDACAAYSLTRWLQLWARGDNLLTWRYEINKGYPMPRATFMGGVELRF